MGKFHYVQYFLKKKWKNEEECKISGMNILDKQWNRGLLRQEHKHGLSILIGQIQCEFVPAEMIDDIVTVDLFMMISLVIIIPDDIWCWSVYRSVHSTKLSGRTF